MRTNDWLQQATKQLEETGITTARLDALVLLEDAVGKDRSYLLAHSEIDLNDPSLRKLNHQLKRRIKHEPLAYIRGKTEFYGRTFIVNAHTLEPRPETETMISQFLPLIQDSLISDEENVSWCIVDVGTGSGCIAVTVKLEIPETEVIATDIDSLCIKAAKRNAKQLGAEVVFCQGDLLQPLYNLSPKPNILLCNLPYVPASHTINTAAMFEPQSAIFGGLDGLDLYRKLFGQIGKSSIMPGFILTESLPFQHKELVQIANKHGYRLKTSEDFIQVFGLR